MLPAFFAFYFTFLALFVAFTFREWVLGKFLREGRCNERDEEAADHLWDRLQEDSNSPPLEVEPNKVLEEPGRNVVEEVRKWGEDDLTHDVLVDVGVRAESSKTARAEANLADVEPKQSSVVEVPHDCAGVPALFIDVE